MSLPSSPESAPAPERQLVVLWDMDGVLVESEPLHVEKIIAVCARHGVQVHPERFSQPNTFCVPDGAGGMRSVTMPLYGAGDKNIYYWLLHQNPALKDTLSLTEYLDQLLAYYLEQKHRLRARDGIRGVIRMLDALGAVQGVVTSGIPAQVQANATALGMEAEMMAFYLTADDVKNTKPHPEPYQTGMARALPLLASGRTPVFVAVEDSAPGVRSAHAAGIPCVQFLLPGQTPFQPVSSARFDTANCGNEVLARILDFFVAKPSPAAEDRLQEALIHVARVFDAARIECPPKDLEGDKALVEALFGEAMNTADVGRAMDIARAAWAADYLRQAGLAS